MTVRDTLLRSAVEKSLRQSTVYSYERLFIRLGILDKEEVTEAEVMEALWLIDNPNTRRAAVIACRSILGFQLRVPKAVPRRYNLPSEDTLRLALMTSPHEGRGLLMMYAGLRIGEACAITFADRTGDRLRIDKQVIEPHQSGRKVLRIGPVKTTEASIVVPHWLGPVVDGLTATTKPSGVRESLRRAGQKVGVALNAHQLRHWYATELLARGVPLSLVSRQLRHSDVATTLRTYSQYDEGDIHRAFPTR
jgi:integrase